jgi:hypothetical protein
MSKTPNEKIHEIALQKAKEEWGYGDSDFTLEQCVDAKWKIGYCYNVAMEAILAAVPLIVEMAREQVETYQTKGGYSFNHHKHDKYPDAESIIKALKGE